MKKLLLFLCCMLSSGLAYSQSDVWRYDAQSGKWFQVIPFEQKKPSVGAYLQNSDRFNPLKGNDRILIPSTANPEIRKYRPRKVYGIVRTNLIGNAVLIPNVGGEITVSRNWSLGTDFYLQWLKDRDKDRFYQTYMLDVDARYWWGRQHKLQSLTGWHAGLYGQAITFDWENGHKGYQSRAFFWTFGIGGELGYNKPISKRLGLDFNIGIGYFHTKYNVYNPGHNRKYYFDHRECRNFFGPTRLGISLNYLIR